MAKQPAISHQRVAVSSSRSCSWRSPRARLSARIRGGFAVPALTDQIERARRAISSARQSYNKVGEVGGTNVPGQQTLQRAAAASRDEGLFGSPLQASATSRTSPPQDRHRTPTWPVKGHRGRLTSISSTKGGHVPALFGVCHEPIRSTARDPSVTSPVRGERSEDLAFSCVAEFTRSGQLLCHGVNCRARYQLPVRRLETELSCPAVPTYSNGPPEMSQTKGSA
jgi:hypothetical protein